MKKLLIASFIFLVAPGCAKRNNAFFYQGRSVNAKKNDDACMYDHVRQQEARLTDIPIPLNAKPVPNGFWVDDKESAGVMLAYTVSVPLQEIVSFYFQEMERFGWDQTVSFDASEQLLIFEKPGKVCTIVLHPVTFFDNNKTKNSIAKNSTSLTIFTGNKRLSL